MAKFKLKFGKHHYGNAKYGTRVTVHPGEVFEAISEKEEVQCLLYPDRYERMRDDTPVDAKEILAMKARKAGLSGVETATAEPEPETITIDEAKLTAMSLVELLRFCRDNNIDTKGAANKESLLKVIIGE